VEQNLFQWRRSLDKKTKVLLVTRASTLATEIALRSSEEWALRRYLTIDVLVAGATGSLAYEFLERLRAPKGQRRWLLPRRWVVERSFAWISHNRRMSKDYERLSPARHSTKLAYSAFSEIKRCGRNWRPESSQRSQPRRLTPWQPSPPASLDL
jgi:hypothetical protein